MKMRRLTPVEVERIDRRVVDRQTLEAASEIVDAVREEGEVAIRRSAERFGETAPGDPLLVGPEELDRALAVLCGADRDLLVRTAGRIEAFARAQRESLLEMTLQVDGGRAGQRIAPVERAGCYAPGGRYPLPSSVVMTAVTARVAGVERVWVASPRPAPVTLAAAAVAGADGVLVVGGAHAIAALAYGFEGFEPCDVVVGPGNRWVTAAKKLVSGRVGIDMLAGPSELVVLADETADPAVVAADLLAQAEHDPDALPVLITTSENLATAVEMELDRQLVDLPTREVAEAALGNGFITVAPDMETAVLLCDRLAPEHLQVMTEGGDEVAGRCRHWGGLFVGAGSAEVLGDYGAGPNHTLPTGGVARHNGGLSVMDFLRVRTWLEIDDAGAARQTIEDSVALARLEGLEAHARAAERRLDPATQPRE
jgi:phosphoribosyl-ATP pyrophosphohydrolase/phosphoribosyl-AMP cyclohydrolase/histidinol dehydrogenase